MQQGVDIIIAQGYEAGGHTGEVATMVLVPDVVDAIAPVPVLAAGGIGSGRQMAAAMALGADGVWTGSIWLTDDRERLRRRRHREAARGDVDRHRAVAGATPASRPASCARRGPRRGRRPSRRARCRCRCSSSSTRTPPGKMGANPPRELVGMPVGQIVSRMNQVRTARQVVFDMVQEYVDVTQRWPPTSTTEPRPSMSLGYAAEHLTAAVRSLARSETSLDARLQTAWDRHLQMVWMKPCLTRDPLREFRDLWRRCTAPSDDPRSTKLRVMTHEELVDAVDDLVELAVRVAVAVRTAADEPHRDTG